MKVAIVTTDNRDYSQDFSHPTPYFGAAPEALLHGLEHFPELEVHVVSCAHRILVAPPKLAPNIFFHSLTVPRLGWMRTCYQGCVRAVRWRLQQIQPDVVHGQGTELDCALDAVFSGFPNVLTLHGNMVDVARAMRSRPFSFHWLAARLETVALGRTSGVFCNSRCTEELVRPRAGRTWLVPNALRPSMFDSPPAPRGGSRCELLHVGSVCANKGQLDMLGVAQRLHQRGLEFRLTFLGACDPQSGYAVRFLRGIREAETAGFARHLGVKSCRELVELYDGAHALVHTPDSEAFGLVVAEALARNLKVFAFDVGGVKDILDGTQDSVRVSGGDWAGMEAALGKWLTEGHPPGVPNSPVMSQRYRPEAIARSHLEIYRDVLCLKLR